jgi:hypothetical protein
MNRRQFVALMAGEIVTWSFPGLAQQAGRTYRLGCLLTIPARSACKRGVFRRTATPRFH